MTNPNFLPAGYLLHHRYSIQSTIGQGGFGITYLAYDQKLDQEVCIKELFVSGNSTRGSNFTVQSQSTGEFSFEEFVQRFIQEARQLAKFQHPNIVRVIDIFQENSTAYMVMEYVKGETLKSKVSHEGALGEKEAMSLIAQLLDAVEEVHHKGMLHRDIKPDNVLITQEGRVVLIDFGSAREFAEGKTTTQTAMLTPGYAPIEQYSARAQRGPYTDIYALGATMYYLLTGEKPIPATDRVAEELTPPHHVNPGVSSQLSSAVMLAMELKSEHRFQSVEEMRGALVSVQEKPEPRKRKESWETESPNLISKKSRKYKGLLWIVILLMILVIGYLVFSKYKDSDNDGIPDSIEGNEDIDNDEIPHYKDEDSDGEGIPDSIEGYEDVDQDGIPNFLDLDSDGDGILDSNEGLSDIDNDGIPNYLDEDRDGDGILDGTDQCLNSSGYPPDGCKYFEKVFLKNYFSETFYLSIAYFHKGKWESLGWNEVQPNSSYEFPLPNEFESTEIYYYATTFIGDYIVDGSEQFCVGNTNNFHVINAKNIMNCERTESFRKLSLTRPITSHWIGD